MIIIGDQSIPTAAFLLVIGCIIFIFIFGVWACRNDINRCKKNQNYNSGDGGAVVGDFGGDCGGDDCGGCD